MTVRRERRFLHGGREVLRAVCDLPQGNCRAAAHFCEIMELWVQFAERELFPLAAHEWETLAHTGRGFAFIPHTARGALTVYPLARGLKISFSATLSVGKEIGFHRTLHTFWDASGNLQYRALKEKKRKQGNRTPT